MKFTNRRFGVEIEFLQTVEKQEVVDAVRAEGVACNAENYNHNDGLPYWKVITDGSCGLEIVSPILSGEDGLQQIEKVCKALNSVGAKVDRTCGLHVHVDARDLNKKQIGRVFLAYARHEKLFDALMPESRRLSNNTYCQSIRNVLNPNWVEEFKKDTLGAYHSYVHSRYRKVNLEAYIVHGTIEFRQHSGTTEAEKIINWVVLMVGFVEETILRPISVKYDMKNCLADFKMLYGIKASDSNPRIAILANYLTKRIRQTSGILASQMF